MPFLSLFFFSHSSGGSGLGLSIAKSIVQLHNGTIGVQANLSAPRTVNPPVFDGNKPTVTSGVADGSTSPTPIPTPTPTPTSGSDFFFTLPLEVYWQSEDISHFVQDHRESFSFASMKHNNESHQAIPNVEMQSHIPSSITSNASAEVTNIRASIPSNQQPTHKLDSTLSTAAIQMHMNGYTPHSENARSIDSHLPTRSIELTSLYSLPPHPSRGINLSGFSDQPTPPVEDLGKALVELQKLGHAPFQIVSSSPSPVSIISHQPIGPTTTDSAPTSTPVSPVVSKRNFSARLTNKPSLIPPGLKVLVVEVRNSHRNCRTSPSIHSDINSLLLLLIVHFRIAFSRTLRRIGEKRMPQHGRATLVVSFY